MDPVFPEVRRTVKKQYNETDRSVPISALFFFSRTETSDAVHSELPALDAGQEELLVSAFVPVSGMRSLRFPLNTPPGRSGSETRNQT